MTKDFLIADFRIRIDGERWAETLGHFGRALRVFEVPHEPDTETVLTLRTDPCEQPDFGSFRTLDEFDFPEVNARCRFAAADEGDYLFSMTLAGGGTLWFHKRDGSPEACCNLAECRGCEEIGSLMRFGLWMLYGIAVAPHHAVAIHSSTICRPEGAVLFLGESGTGKSTHTRLWLDHIPEATLLNDDSPVIRMKEGVPTVYGSPWSGKTPCYRQESHPIRALVRLSQAPENRMQRLPVIRAIGALLPSCPPAFAYDTALQDAVCETLSEILSRTPVYHLACLPDAGAARLSFETALGHAADR